MFYIAKKLIEDKLAELKDDNTESGKILKHELEIELTILKSINTDIDKCGKTKEEIIKDIIERKRGLYLMQPKFYKELEKSFMQLNKIKDILGVYDE